MHLTYAASMAARIWSTCAVVFTDAIATYTTFTIVYSHYVDTPIYPTLEEFVLRYAINNPYDKN